MQTYKHPKEDRNFYSPDQEPTTDLAFNLWHVSGLDNYSIPHPLYQKRSDYAAAHGITPEAAIDILQQRVNEAQTELAELEDLARQNDIPPGALRGQ